MNYRTPLTEARGLGSANSGTMHWWMQRVTAFALIPLSYWLIKLLDLSATASYEQTQSWLSKPLNPVGVLAFIVVVFYHAGLGLHPGPVTTPTARGMACGPLTSADVVAVNGSIALIDRGICTFVTKVKNAQNAGAIGVIIADNLAGSPPGGLGGTDPTITIPSVRITQADGAVLKNALRFRSRTKSGVIGTLGVDMNVRLGASPDGRALLWTPNPYQRGTSVSYWDIIAFPNLLMEAEVSPDVTHNVDVPYDLTLPIVKDIGW